MITIKTQKSDEKSNDTTSAYDVDGNNDAHVLTDIEYEIVSAGEVVAGVRYPHQQFALE
jgi:hypothetical protein